MGVSLKEERENRVGGSVGGKRRKVRGFFGKTTLSFPFLNPEQRRGGGSSGAAGCGDCRRAGPRQRPGGGGKWRGRRGGLIPTLTLGRGGARRRLHRRWRTGGGGARGRRRSSA
jgi:hypothetical protein